LYKFEKYITNATKVGYKRYNRIKTHDSTGKCRTSKNLLPQRLGLTVIVGRGAPKKVSFREFLYTKFMYGNFPYSQIHCEKISKNFHSQIHCKQIFQFPLWRKVSPKKDTRWVFRIKNGCVLGDRGGTLL